MKLTKNQDVREVPLPFSDGLLSAKLWKVKNRFVASVPELGLSCYGESDTEASFRLFTALLKYYRQLKAHKEKLGEKGLDHLVVLTRWMEGIEKRMSGGSTADPRSHRESNLVSLSSRRPRF